MDYSESKVIQAFNCIQNWRETVYLVLIVSNYTMPMTISAHYWTYLVTKSIVSSLKQVNNFSSYQKQGFLHSTYPMIGLRKIIYGLAQRTETFICSIFVH